MKRRSVKSPPLISFIQCLSLALLFVHFWKTSKWVRALNSQVVFHQFQGLSTVQKEKSCYGGILPFLLQSFCEEELIFKHVLYAMVCLNYLSNFIISQQIWKPFLKKNRETIKGNFFFKSLFCKNCFFEQSGRIIKPCSRRWRGSMHRSLVNRR